MFDCLKICLTGLVGMIPEDIFSSLHSHVSVPHGWETPAEGAFLSVVRVNVGAVIIPQMLVGGIGLEHRSMHFEARNTC